MTQVSDYDLANLPGAAFRAELNLILQALASSQSGPTAPSATFPGMWWADTSVNPMALKIRNAADNAWIKVPTASNTFLAAFFAAETQLQGRTALGIDLETFGLEASGRVTDWHALTRPGFYFSDNNVPNRPGPGSYFGLLFRLTEGNQLLFVINRTTGEAFWASKLASWGPWQAFGRPTLGIGQTSTDVLASRSFGVAYTNSTEGPMLAQVCYVSKTTNNMFCYMEIDEGQGAGFQRRMDLPADRHMSAVLTGIIPPGGRYRVSGSNITHVRSWWETAA